jgi:hypothetical protein
MRATLRTVDLVEVFQWELELRCERLDTSTELAFWERRKFVEKRLNYCWVKDNHRKLKDKPGKEVSQERENGELGNPTKAS